jgi:site-specific DNA-cytosine methylase
VLDRGDFAWVAAARIMDGAAFGHVLDLIVGGPPCRELTVAGPRQTPLSRRRSLTVARIERERAFGTRRSAF